MSSSNSNSNSNQNLQYLSKRALQIQHDEGVAAIPNKPSPANTPPVRRARAGTLPSNLSSIPNYPTQFNQPPPLNLSKAGLSPAAIESLDYASNPQKPGLRHSHSSALNFEKSPRLRSGSLTLPPSSPSVQRLADPFGSRFFYSRSNSQIGAIGDELKSSDLPSEDACLRTLDYLGLDDPPSTPSSPHTNHSNPSLSIPKPSHISLNSPTRSRAYTLSTSKAADPFKTSSSTSSPSCQPPNDHLHPDSASLVNNSNLNDYQSFLKDPQDPLFNSFNNPSYNSNSTQSSRPRAISMGILDEPDVIRAPARSGVPFPDSSHPHPLQQSFNSYDLEMSHLDDPYSSLNQVHTQQVPTRSLWIGGLDPRTTAQELMHVFAPYGAIESLRLLTDKECGFVNFVEKSDALRARDDVMHRLAGRIPISTTNGGANSSTPVRIGFGKIDSPQNPPSTSSLLNSTNNSTLSVPNSVPNQINFDGTTEQPTRALWLGSIPSTTTPATLLALFGPFGPIESARVLTHKNCGFVNYERLDDAVRARKSLNGRELLGPEIGAVRVGFAKVPVKSTGIDDSANTIIFPSSASAPNGGHPQALANSLIGVQGVSDIPVEQQIASGQTENYRSNLMMNLLQNGTKESVVNSLSPKLEKVDPDERPSVNDQQMIMSILSGGNQDDIRSVSDLRPAATYYTSIPPILPAVNGIDNQPIRKFDSSKLRELRKRLENQDGSNSDKRRSSADEMNDEYYDDENGQFPFSEDPEILATRPMSEGGLIDNIVDLASDYIGNTIIQKLFEVCTLQAKMCMLNDLAPHLAMIGCHKNGTWAAQKIIDCASTAEEINLIVQHIRPYAPPLLLDQFGNYVNMGYSTRTLWSSFYEGDIRELAYHITSTETLSNINNTKFDSTSNKSKWGVTVDLVAGHFKFTSAPDYAQIGIIDSVKTIDEYKRQEYMEAIKRVLTNGNVKITNPAAYRRLLDEINMPMNKLNIMQPLPGTTGGSGSGSTGGTPPTTTFSPQLQPMQPIYGGMTPPASLMNLQLQAHAQAQAQAADHDNDDNIDCDSEQQTKDAVQAAVDDVKEVGEKGVGLKTFTLNRPRALNALNRDMMKLIRRRIGEWDANPSTGVIVSSGVGKAYCAGGDVKSIALNANKAEALQILKEEFELDHELSVLTKPYIALMDGYTMGGGAGIALPAPVRISTDNTYLSFPETRLGYAPDVGASYYLSRLDGQLGTYLSLTGAGVSGSDAYHLGLSTHHVSPSLFPALLARLSDLPTPVTAAAVSGAVEEYTTHPLPRLSEEWRGAHRRAIDDAFGQASVEDIVQVLQHQAEGGNKGVSVWATSTLHTLRQRPPTSLRVALEAVRRGMKMHSVAQALHQEHTFADGFLHANDDFAKGVQAVLVDKATHPPDWFPRSLRDTHKADVLGAYFAGTQRVHGANALDLRSEKRPLHAFRDFTLPSEHAVESYVRGSHPASGANAVTRDEVLAFFKSAHSNKQSKAVADKVQEVLDRCAEEKGGYMRWI
ncbi:hypothetical protein E3P92_00742 [Wallemia ichthyophaga]|nr:hypothetical protein E3P98_00723 [Wallemia ichthyophaga]TIB18177.1 hypothetical protein E3P92_00742 [Wallemia ichthyophaga]